MTRVGCSLGISIAIHSIPAERIRPLIKIQKSRSFACAMFAGLFTRSPKKIILQRRQQQVGAEISRGRDAKHVRTLKESGGSEVGCVHVYVCVQTDYIPIRTLTYHRIFYFVIQRPFPPTSPPPQVVSSYFADCIGAAKLPSFLPLLSPFPVACPACRVVGFSSSIFHRRSPRLLEPIGSHCSAAERRSRASASPTSYPLRATLKE